jgi:hypothetical protein
VEVENVREANFCRIPQVFLDDASLLDEVVRYLYTQPRHTSSRAFLAGRFFNNAIRRTISYSVRMPTSSNKRLEHELSGVQPINGFHQDLKSQSIINSNGSALDRGATPARLTRPEAFSSIIHVSHPCLSHDG